MGRVIMQFARRLAYLTIVLAMVLMPSVASAFSSFGAGTVDNPYRISSCAQLKEIDNNLSGYYVLITSLNCSASTFAHLAQTTAFSGTLDGQNNTISHLNTDSDGLFYQTSGATIKNLKVSSGTAHGASFAGSFVARATNTTLTNLHSAMDVSTNAGGYAGGIAGVLYGTSSITASSYTGSVTNNGYAGGMAGVMQDSGTSVTDSFVGGDYNVNGVDVGAIVGGLLAGTVSRVYSNGIIRLNGHIANGGLVGKNSGLLRDSFSATTFAGNMSQNGAVSGENTGGSYTNVFFDQTLSGTSSVCGTGSGCSATALNVSNSSPDVLKNNSTAGPLSTWDFINIWSTTSTYPTLRNLSTFNDQANIPNDGDANNDGVVDLYQANVKSVKNSSGAWTTVRIPDGNSCSIDNIAGVDANAAKEDVGYTPQTLTMTAFNVYCLSSGTTVPVTLILDKQYDVSKSVLRFFNPTTNTYSTVAGAVFGTSTIGGVVKTTATYSITDGGSYDTDGAADGVIKDPVGIEIVPTNIGAPNTGLEPFNSTRMTVYIIAGIIIILGTLYGRKKAV